MDIGPERSKHRLKVVLLAASGIYLAMMGILGYAWYSPQWISSFHFFNDAPEWKQMDKFAHFYWTFQVSVLSSRLLGWARISEKQALLYGAGMGFFFVSGIEVADGFSAQYGASIFDIMANALGASCFVGQCLLWKKIAIWPKFSFHPTQFAPLRPALLGNGLLEEVLKDYNGQTFWYSATFSWLPLPKWLCLAVGVSAEGMVYSRDLENEAVGFSPHRRYFISIDLNLSHLQTSSRFANAALWVLNIIKIPAPTVEFSTRGIRFHPIYF